MPPQVGKAGGGTGPVVVHENGGFEGPKSSDLKNKPAEQKQAPTNSTQTTPYRATTKEASSRKSELAAVAVSQQTTIWKTFNNLATAASAAVGELTANAARSVQQQDMLKLSRREYRQDMIPGQNFEVEKITPGNANKTQTQERTENLSRGDVYETRRHPEQQRESTKSGLENRLKELNQGKELTPFEKKLVAEWDPNKKDGVVSLSPIKAVDGTGTKGPVGIQGYRVERGEADSNYRQVSYYDRDGNELVRGPSIQKQKINSLAKSDHPQDMVPGEYFHPEDIRPGNKNETQSGQGVDMARGRLRSSQVRESTKSGLEDRLKELNFGKELTPFEKKIVAEWDQTGRKENAIGSLSPIMTLDSTGTRGSMEVQGYKVIRGGSGNKQTTYYDRQGNILRESRTGGDAISTDGPMDYIAVGTAATKLAGRKIAERFARKEVEAVAKAEANAITKAEAKAMAETEKAAAKSETTEVAKAETGTAARTAEQRAAKSETETAAQSVEQRAATKQEGKASAKKEPTKSDKPDVMLSSRGRTPEEQQAINNWREQQRRVDDQLRGLEPGQLDVIGDTLEATGSVPNAAKAGGRVRQVREALKNSNLDNLPEGMVDQELRNEIEALRNLENEMIDTKQRTSRQLRD